jgi:hypothetical protein
MTYQASIAPVNIPSGVITDCTKLRAVFLTCVIEQSCVVFF